MHELKPYQAEWKPIEGWPYSVSDDGHVRNDRTGHILKMHKMNRAAGLHWEFVRRAGEEGKHENLD